MYLKHEVSTEDNAKTAEFVLRKNLRISRKLSKKIRNNRALTKNGEWCLNKDLVFTGDILEVHLHEENELVGPVENKSNIEIVLEDENYLIVNKPPFLPTHPRFYGDPALTTELSDFDLHAASRLDTGTSGLVILAKNSHAHNLISQTPIDKIYLGLVHGEMPERGSIEEPIGRERDTIILRKVREDGKEAITHYRRLAYWPEAEASLMSYKLETGRTHQIRVHSRYLNHPLVGDEMYGWEQTFRFAKEYREDGKLGYFLQADDRSFNDPTFARDFTALELNRELKRQFLHAYLLKFIHPFTGEEIKIIAKPYEDLQKLLDIMQSRNYIQYIDSAIDELLEIETVANVQL